MADKKHILYVLLSGLETPFRPYSPFFLGMTARAMDIEATVYFTAQGVTVLKKGEAEKIKEGYLPPLNKVMAQAAAAGVKFVACEQSLRFFNLDQAAIIDGVKLVGYATLNDLVLNADATMWF